MTIRRYMEILSDTLLIERLPILNWRISSYREMSGLVVDLIIETPSTFLTVEVKSGRRVHERMSRNRKRFAPLVDRPDESVRVYRGEVAQWFEGAGLALPCGEFLDRLAGSADPA